MPLDSVLGGFGALQQRILDFASDPTAIDADSSDNHRVFLGFLSEACELVRAQDSQDPDFGDVVAQANKLINTAVTLAYEKLEFDFLPSFAHSAEHPALTGPYKDKNILSHRLSGFLDLMEQWIARGTMKRPEDPSLLPKLPPPWKTTPRPHSLSSLLSRFDGAGGRDYGFPLIRAIYDARCEISSDLVAQPIGLTNNGSCLMVSSMGGYKNRSPLLTYFLLNEARPSRGDFPLKARHANVGLTEIAWASATDESKKLMFIADTWRVKSYAWADDRGEIYKRALPTHTLQSDNHHGPLHIFAPGRLLRAGKGSVGVWNLDTLETHGPKGKARIGPKFDTSDSWRDEDDELEASSGSDPTSVIALADPQIVPVRWHAHPSSPATMLCGTDTAKSKDYSCISVDLEHGGKVVSRYLGHGGDTRAFSTSVADPNVFLTAASDGYSRLYDHRVTLPVLSLRAGSGEDDCAGVVLVHPDGVPTVFTGAAHDQVIRLWDVRAQKMVYELSTGNNAVTGMTWDDPQSTLYVATACDYMDRNGETFDYRRAKIPRDSRGSKSRANEEDESMEDEDDSEEEDDYDSEDEDDDEAPCWPKDAAYAEDYFGHLFDPGNHRILRYAFKDQADPSILPEYGDASLDMEPSW